MIQTTTFALSTKHLARDGIGDTFNQPAKPITPKIPDSPTSTPCQQQQHQHQQQHYYQRHQRQQTPTRLSTPTASSQTRSPLPASQSDGAFKPDSRRVHVEAASIGIARTTPSQEGNKSASSISALPSSTPSGRRVSPRHRRPLSQDLTEDPDEQSSDRPESRHQLPAYSRANEPRNAHPVVRVSKHTHSAILYALEQALRNPNPFTPDVIEESAEMADLAEGAGVTAAPAAVPRPTAAPAPTSSPSGIRGPRMIMQERAAREARQKAEAERLRLEQARAQEEVRLTEESRRRNAERRSAAAAAGQGNAADVRQSSQQHGSQQQNQLTTENAQQRAGANAQTLGQSQQPSPPRVSHNPAHQQTPSQIYLAQGNAAQRPPQENRQTDPAAPAATQEPSKPRNSFPHAFERWETLSAHWEGLTSYWIRRLEQNKDDINRDPLSQQLARQVTDLSAAGANLFHAVVELQRLRASSERKFQRWFFETRSDLERAQEVKALLEAALEKERRDRADAIREAVDQERGISKTQKQLAEMRKELAISKEEARRAWEELGRREQDERQRTLSLQAGAPTIVGGVQVVPMTQGHARHHSTRDQSAHQPEYEPGPSAAQSPTPPGQRSPPTPDTRGYYQQGEPSRRPDVPPEAAEDDYLRDPAGNYILDVHGRRIPRETPMSAYSGSDPEADEYETPATTNPPSGGHEPPTTSAGSTGQWTGAYSGGQDYTGEGYGAPGWETVPRHHHPTRLSDVIEEDDERSRTSASQISRGA